MSLEALLKYKRGGTLVELTLALVMLGVILGSLGFYMNSYEQFNEESRVQSSLQLGRLAAIPAMSIVDSNGNVLMDDSQLLPVLSMYLATSYVERNLLHAVGPDGCADPNSSGAIRGFIATLPPDNRINPNINTLVVDIRTKVFTCNLNYFYDKSIIPPTIIEQIQAYAAKPSQRYRDYIVVYSASIPRFGAVIIPTLVTRYSTPVPSASPRPS